MKKSCGWACLLVATAGLAGCTEARTAHQLQSDNPLGASFWLVPTPSEGSELLGRAFVRPPDATFSLEEQSQPNPCEGELASAAPTEMSNHYENAIDLRSAASGQALLGQYGFSGQATSASHLLYKVTTARKLTRLDTNAYVSCCQQHDCGWGYVSALIYGEGEYVSAREADASGSASYQVVTASGRASYKALERKQIRGWLAAVLTAHDRSSAMHACPPEQQWGGYECVERELASDLREVCASNEADNPLWAENPTMQHRLREQKATACRWLDEHGMTPNVAH